MKTGLMTSSVLQDYLASWRNRAFTQSSRRRSRSSLASSAEVLETRIILTVTVEDDPIDPAAINGQFAEIASGNFDGSGGIDCFVWDPRPAGERPESFADRSEPFP